MLFIALLEQREGTPIACIDSVAPYTHWSTTNTWVSLPTHHSKINFWTWSAFPFLMILPLQLRILCIIERMRFFHLLDSRIQIAPFPKIHLLMSWLKIYWKQITVTISLSKQIENLRNKCKEDRNIPLKMVRIISAGPLLQPHFRKPRFKGFCPSHEWIFLWS